MTPLPVIVPILTQLSRHETSHLEMHWESLCDTLAGHMNTGKIEDVNYAYDSGNRHSSYLAPIMTETATILQTCV